VDANITGLPVTDATERAAPPRASPSSFDKHDAGEVHALVEGERRVHGVLADHRVNNEQDFVGHDGAADLACLLHHVGVDAEAAGGVHDDDVVKLLAGFLNAGAGNLHRVPGRVVQFGGRGSRVGREDRHLGPLTHHLELGDSVGALQVTGHQHGAVALGLQPLGQLAGEGGLTRALEAGQHDDGGAVLGQADPAGFAAQDLHQFLVDDLDDLLARVQRTRNLGAQGAFAHPGRKFTDYGNGNVRVQKGAADLPHCGINVRLSEAALAAEILEGCCQPVRE
jgi:hypothetical protein